jgi:hypothetical protein
MTHAVPTILIPCGGEHREKLIAELPVNSRVALRGLCGYLELRCMQVCGAPREIRTPGLLVRSQTLYPTELGAHKYVRASVKSSSF